ncbi:hypothetical protein HUU42_01590 [bacterium]|nr:hypothetical protein [bacterium]
MYNLFRALISRAVFLILISSLGFAQELKKDSSDSEMHFKSPTDSAGFFLKSSSDSLILKTDEKIKTLGFVGDSLFKSPWGAVGRSLVLPGWGQLYNEQPLKAGMFAAADVSMLLIYHHKDKKVTRIEKKRKTIDRQLKNDPFLTEDQRTRLTARFNSLTGDLDDALNSRNLYGWFFALSHLLSLVDAYVDAHLFKFDDKMELAYDPVPDGYILTMRIRW